MLRNDVYEVEEVIGKKYMNGRVLYRVRWRGFSSDHDSWEPGSNLRACRLLVRRYNEEHVAGTENAESEATDANSRKRSLPENSSPQMQDKGPAAKKQKLSKTDSKLKLHGYKQSKATGNDGSVSRKTFSETPQSGKQKQKGSEQSKDIDNAKGKIKKTKSVISKQSSEHLVVNENGEVAKTFGVKNSNDSKELKHGKNLSQNSVNKSQQPVGTPVRKIFLKQQNGSEQSRERIDQLRRLLELQKQKLDKSSNNAINKLAKSKGDSSNKQTKTVVKVAPKAKGENCCSQIVAESEKGVELETVDLTKSPSDSSTFFTPTESIEISDDEDDDDGEDVLYSLNADCDVPGECSSSCSNNRDSSDSKSSSVIKISNVATKLQRTKDGGSTKTKKKKGVSLMDSKQKDKLWTDKSGEPMRPVSPPPHFTTVKEPSGSPENPDPSKPSGPDPVSPEASETYLADVPTSFSVTSGSVLNDDVQPLSPGSMSYKSFLHNLPEQLIPGVKRGGKKGGKVTTVARSNFSVLGNHVSSTSTMASSTSMSTGIGVVERRASVRASECAFRYKQIVVKKCFHFTQIWLNTQTPTKNALNPAVIQELISAMNSAKYDDSHLVLFSGFGPVFCSGTDLHYLVTGDRRLAARQMAERIRELTKTFISFPKPIIAAVSGAAVGLGVSLLLLCDVVYASDKASFHLPYSQLSQTPEGCSSFTLPHTLGLPSANELLFGGRKITAMEAYQLGLVSQVFWPTLMMQEVIPRAQNMAASSAKALEATKLLVRSHYRSKMELTNETECNLLLERWLSVDCQHAIEAYIANEKNWAF